MLSALMVLFHWMSFARCTSDIKSLPNVLFRTAEPAFRDLHPLIKEKMFAVTRENPVYRQVYFSASDRWDFVKKFYPQYMNDYKNLLPGAYKADLFRYLLIYRYGGVYADIGMLFTKPLQEILFPSDEFVGAVDFVSSNLFNGFFAAYARHPLLRVVIAIVEDNLRHMRYNCNNLDITGPKVLGRAFRMLQGVFRSGEIFSGAYAVLGNQFHLYKFTGTGQTIIDQNDSILARNKFEGLNDILYKHSISYGGLYYMHQVYAPEMEVNKQQQKYVNVSGNLVNIGKSYFYVDHDTRRGFPNYDVFLDMGFEECMASKGKMHQNLASIPLGSMFSVNATANLLETNLFNCETYLNSNWNLDHTFFDQIPINMRMISLAKLSSEIVRYGEFLNYAENEWYIIRHQQQLLQRLPTKDSTHKDTPNKVRMYLHSPGGILHQIVDQAGLEALRGSPALNTASLREANISGALNPQFRVSEDLTTFPQSTNADNGASVNTNALALQKAWVAEIFGMNARFWAGHSVLQLNCSQPAALAWFGNILVLCLFPDRQYNHFSHLSFQWMSPNSYREMREENTVYLGLGNETWVNFSQTGAESQEDARLLLLTDNSVFCMFVSYHRVGPQSISTARQEYSVLSYDPALNVTNISKSRALRVIGEQQDRQQKNWVPFLYNNTVHFIMSISPFHVGVMEPEDPKTVNTYVRTVVEDEEGWIPWQLDYGVPISGGTPPILLGDFYLAIFHTSIRIQGRRCFYMGGYTFSAKPPFRLLAMSKYPIVHPKLYAGGMNGIVPSSLVLDKTKKHFYIYAGHQDTYKWVIKIALRSFLQQLYVIST